MDPDIGPWLIDLAGNVEPDRADGAVIPAADPGALGQFHLIEFVECIACVKEDGDAPVFSDRLFQFYTADEHVLAADDISFIIGRAQRSVLVPADALVAPGKKPKRNGQFRILLILHGHPDPRPREERKPGGKRNDDAPVADKLDESRR